MEHLNLTPSVAAQAASARPAADTGAVRLEAVWARHLDEVRAAQRLRYDVFAGEMGAQLAPWPGAPAGHDVDRFDDACEHLIARTVETPDSPSQVVGTYRLLTPTAARMMGQLYSDDEFDLSKLDALRPRLAELGRSCVAPEWRTGGAILMLWSSLAQFMVRNGLDVVIGCASIPMRDGGHSAASLWQQLRHSHLADDSLRVTPRLALPVGNLRSDLIVDAPPLIKGYLKCGGQVLGAPAWDPDFCTADLPMMLDMGRMPSAYRRRFLAS